MSCSVCWIRIVPPWRHFIKIIIVHGDHLRWLSIRRAGLLLLRLNANVRVHQLVDFALVERVVEELLADARELTILQFVLQRVPSLEDGLLSLHHAQVVLVVRRLVDQRKPLSQVLMGEMLEIVAALLAFLAILPAYTDLLRDFEGAHCLVE